MCRFPDLRHRFGRGEWEVDGGGPLPSNRTFHRGGCLYTFSAFGSPSPGACVAGEDLLRGRGPLDPSEEWEVEGDDGWEEYFDEDWKDSNIVLSPMKLNGSDDLENVLDPFERLGEFEDLEKGDISASYNGIVEGMELAGGFNTVPCSSLDEGFNLFLNCCLRY